MTDKDAMSRDVIYAQISVERERQDKIWGGPEYDDRNSPTDWIAFLTKHVGLAVHWPWNVTTFRHQMVVVAAIAVAAIEWADRDGDNHERKAKR
jgi:hypothetical protein